MSNRTYRVTEIVGTSPEGIDQAVRNGVERAARTLRGRLRGRLRESAACPGGTRCRTAPTA